VKQNACRSLDTASSVTDDQKLVVGRYFLTTED
jgi:hypothetical protein